MNRRIARKAGFSLIEVLFAVLFLVFVGLAMSALNSAAARLITTAEVKIMASSLNEQSLSYVALLKKTKGTNFQSFITNPAGLNCINNQACEVFVICSNSQESSTSLTENCSLGTTDTKTQLGKSRLQFSSKVKLMPADSADPHKRYLVLATTSWGAGVSRSVIASQLVE